jgi:hypothetical protein
MNSSHDHLLNRVICCLSRRSEDAPLLEKLLIQQAALCWLKLNPVELSYSGTMKQSITLTLGM